MYNFIFINLFGMEELIDSIPEFYLHSCDAFFITDNILKTIQFFNISNHSFYLDNSINSSMISNVFLDTEYWNFNHLRSRHSHDNSFSWNYLNSSIKHNLNSADYWINLYPINIDDYFWTNNEASNYKLGLYNFLTNIYNIDYINLRNLKHHDYNNDIYLCSSLFWRHYVDLKTVLPGFYFFWYENYGSVEIGLKTFLTHWYQLIYPGFEFNLAIQPSWVSKTMTNWHNISLYTNGFTPIFFEQR